MATRDVRLVPAQGDQTTVLVVVGHTPLAAARRVPDANRWVMRRTGAGPDQVETVDGDVYSLVAATLRVRREALHLLGLCPDRPMVEAGR